MKHYNFNITTFEAISEKEKDRIFDGIVEAINENLATCSFRSVSEGKWKEIMEVLNK